MELICSNGQDPLQEPAFQQHMLIFGIFGIHIHVLDAARDEWYPNIQQQVREAPSVPVCWWRAFLNGLGKGQDVCLKLERRMQMTCTECYFLSRASQHAPFLFSNFYQLNSLLISEETPRWFSSFFEWEVKYFSLHKCNIQGCLFWCTCKLTLRASLLCFDTIVHQVDNC